MPLLRRYLHWIAIVLLAIFAPLVAVAIYAAERIRTRKRLADVADGETVIAFPKAAKLRTPAQRPEGGAVILAFRQRSAPAIPLPDPQAMTGSQ